MQLCPRQCTPQHCAPAPNTQPYLLLSQERDASLACPAASTEQLAGSVLWKCFLRFGGTVVAGLLGLGALYFSFLCNGLSFDNRVPKVIGGDQRRNMTCGCWLALHGR